MSIECTEVNFTYFEDRKNTINEISCSFSRDNITVLTGASGSGKSTLLYLLAGIYPKNAGFLKSGTITVEGVVPDSLSAKDKCRLVGMMFQNPELQFCMDTVRHEMIFCLENVCEDPAKMDGLIDEALGFCGISHLKDRSLLSLSGGERQKVMLACMVMLEPKWLLLDEPFANIDDASAKAIAAKLKELHRLKGTGILAVDHRLDTWVDIADEVCIISGGSVCSERMRIDELSPQKLEELGLIGPGTKYPADFKAPESSEVVLEIKNLSLKHEGKDILTEINAEFCKGHIYAILGQSGCGKSSLFGAVSGLYKYSGKIFLEGREYNPKKKKELGKIGFVTQNPQDQFVADRVKDEILVSLKRKGDEAMAECESILRSIKLWRYRDISAYMLSQGQQRRLGTAALMAYECKVLLCDEPTYAQDRNNTIAIMDGLCRQAREHGAVLIFTTHDPALARDYSDKMFELKEGRLYEKN